LLLCASAARSSANPKLTIAWTAPAECPAQADVVARVARSLEDDAIALPLTATATVTQTPGMYRAQLRTRSAAGTGERVLENTNCEILADSVALVIALSAGSHADEGPGFAIAISAHATGASGVLPALALGVGGAVALEGLWAVRLELSGTYYVEQSSTYARTNAGAQFRLLRFGVRGCRIWTFGRLELAPCVGAELYRIEAEGFGGMTSHTEEAFVWGPAVGVFGRLRLLPGFAVYLSADVVAAIVRRRFVYKDADPLHRPSALAFQLFIAPEVQF
jgi:hypothetical protein